MAKKFYGISEGIWGSDPIYFLSLGYKNEVAFRKNAIRFIEKFKRERLTKSPKEFTLLGDKVYGAKVEFQNSRMTFSFLLGYKSEADFKDFATLFMAENCTVGCHCLMGKPLRRV